MNCEKIRQQLGRFLDDELAPDTRAEVSDHLDTCAACSLELEGLHDLTSALSDSQPVSVPADLWACIERGLDSAKSGSTPRHETRSRLLRQRPWALAASLVVIVGLGIIGLSLMDNQTLASTVDFSILLDALPLDAQKAFRKFLVRYDARESTPVEARRYAPDLNFDVPEILPGGFRLQAVYELRIGGTKGIAADYDRDGEFLAAVFHPPMKHEKFGSHENYPCVIGERCGHKVQVGEWKLVHLTDPTTCHCLLSRLDEQREMPDVMNAIAPILPSALPNRD